MSLTIAQGNFSRQLKLTHTHFLHVDGFMTYARNVTIGASLPFMGEDNSLQTGTIIAKEIVMGTGLYNPYTKVMPCLFALKSLLECFGISH